MREIAVDVAVIGGGSTGVGVMRDAALRGFSVALVDKSDLGQGTTGRFHGQLHSGGRYVVSDPESASECASENAVLRRIHADAIEDTGGLFVSLPGDDLDYSERWKSGATAAGVPFEEISCSAALKREPRLNPGLTRAFVVRDASIDGWQLVWGAARSAMDHGAHLLTYHRVVGMERFGSRIEALRCRDERSGEDLVVRCGQGVNAAGPWAGHVAELAGCKDVDVVPGRGVMVAMNHRLVNSVINRCVWPGDGGTLVPAHTVCIIGTTDVRADDPDNLAIPHAEVQQMLDSGEDMVPGFRKARAPRAWAGARPLFRDTRVSDDDTRHMSRGMSILDHAQRDGIENFISVIGGKLSTYRLMAEKVVDLVCEHEGGPRPCTTAQEPVSGRSSHGPHRVSDRLSQREHERAKDLSGAAGDRLDDQVICECELMTRGMLTTLMREQPSASFDDLRRQLRMGMGPCQGGFCSQRAAGIGVAEGLWTSPEATLKLREFVERRWHGVRPVLYGEQARQAALNNWIHRGTLDIAHVPGADTTTRGSDATV